MIPLQCHFICLLPLSYYLCEFSPPLSTISTKRWAQILDRLGWNHVKWGSFSQFGTIWITYKRYLIGLIQGQASSHLQMRVIMHHVDLNNYSSFSRSNTRFTSPQTCHMLPLDHFKHTSNSCTIQASNSFDFHEWAYLNVKDV